MSDGVHSVAPLPPLEAGEVQIWRIDLAEIAESKEILGIYKGHLSQEEFDRAERFRASQVRIQFVVARACLRVLLGNILGLTPKEVPITLTAYGKPEVAPVNGQPVFFSVAHSRETILIALCLDSPAGIDLEYLDRETDIVEVARASFTAAECRQIEELTGAGQRQRAFFQCWTRKEAVVKADGRGLSLALNSFEVPVREAAQSVPVSVVEREGGAGVRHGSDTWFSETWFVSDLAVGEAIAAAIAVGVTPLRLTTRLFPLAAVHAAARKA